MYPFSSPQGPNPSVVIYQNPDYVAGILQELYSEGLLEFMEVEQSSKLVQSGDLDKSVAPKVSGRVGVPSIGHLEGSMEGKIGKSEREETGVNGGSKRRSVYSQAYYLQLVRKTLHAQSRVLSITSAVDCVNLASGDIVDFQSTFRANEVNALLDIATPELVGALTAFLHRRKAAKAVKNLANASKVDAEWKKFELEAASRGEMARAVAAATRTDFRSDGTREFYGAVGVEPDDITAITICDNNWFSTADHDRILDGDFKVLGKVVSGVEQDTPVLGRNKVLSRVNADYLEAILEKFDLDAQAKSVVQSFSGPILNTNFTAKLNGPSFRALPI